MSKWQAFRFGIRLSLHIYHGQKFAMIQNYSHIYGKSEKKNKREWCKWKKKMPEILFFIQAKWILLQKQFQEDDYLEVVIWELLHIRHFIITVLYGYIVTVITSAFTRIKRWEKDSYFLIFIILTIRLKLYKNKWLSLIVVE